ncbi:MAG: RHS repeat-associated core domain-containing protein [Bacteroidia bacterium]|nr:RHS repeat-associated core domain-containing protein [Bacteroidia bacterium]
MIEKRPDLSGVTQAVYGDYANQLTAISEISDLTRGFKKISSGADGYEYDNNGNLTADGYRGITGITYNHLNLPAKITYSAQKYLEFTYDASGRKWKKTAVDGGTTTEKYYFGPIEYNGSTLEALYHEEGRAVPDGNGGYDYEYAIRDHLGSTRVMFQMVGGVAALIEEHHNYPFGMELSGPAFVGGGNPYRYTGKEWETDLDLGLYDFGARWYDPAAARWWGVDAMAEKFKESSPFTYSFNNPINFIDPNGRAPIPPDNFVFNAQGELIERTKTDQPDRFFVKEDVLTVKLQMACVQISEIQQTETEITLDSDIGHMARTIFAEAGGQSAEAMVAVGEVIRNRAEDDTPASQDNNYNAQFSSVSTYKEVVTQQGQFESVTNSSPMYSNTLNHIGGDGTGGSERNETRTTGFIKSMGAAIKVDRQNSNTTQGATHFFSPYIPTPSWANSMTKIPVQGVNNKDFRFYKYK